MLRLYADEFQKNPCQRLTISNLFSTLFNLYVLQDPSIRKSKFLIKGKKKNDKMYPYDFLLFNLRIYVHNIIVKHLYLIHVNNFVQLI